MRVDEPDRRGGTSTIYQRGLSNVFARIIPAFLFFKYCNIQKFKYNDSEIQWISTFFLVPPPIPSPFSLLICCAPIVLKYRFPMNIDRRNRITPTQEAEQARAGVPPPHFPIPGSLSYSRKKRSKNIEKLFLLPTTPRKDYQLGYSNCRFSFPNSSRKYQSVLSGLK